MIDPVVVHNRVDALTLAYRVDLNEPTLRELARAGRVARDHGRSSAGIAGHEWELKCGAGESVYLLRRDQHARVKIDLHAPGAVLVQHKSSGWREDKRGDVKLNRDGSLRFPVRSTDDVETTQEAGWTVEVIFYASHLAEHALAGILQ
jgi:hypothetical protein